MKLPATLLQQIAHHLASVGIARSSAAQAMPTIANRVPILAISGGRDSMLLLHCFAQYYTSCYKSPKQVDQKRDASAAANSWHYANIKKPIVWHLQHGLRADAEKDLELVRQECKRLDLSFYYESRFTVDRFAARCGLSIEESGRLLRYRALARLVNKFAPAYAVTAHHADDYLESVLINLIRGGGWRALQTLAVWSHLYMGKSGDLLLLRPFLNIRRTEISNYVHAHGIPYRDDTSNATLDFLRNRLRAKVTPLLYKEGLDPVQLWHNFHAKSSHAPLMPMLTETAATFPATSRTQRPTSYRPQYLALDRSLLGPGLELKSFFDNCLRRLGLAPCSAAFLYEIRKQLERQAYTAHFRLCYNCRQFYLWANHTGPLWLISHRAHLWRPPRLQALRELLAVSAGKNENVSSDNNRNTNSLWQIEYNDQKRHICLKAGESIITFRPGLRVPLINKKQGARRQGTKKLKKVLQEAGLPPPVRANLPLIWHAPNNYVRRILFSFWQDASSCSRQNDRHFEL